MFGKTKKNKDTSQATLLYSDEDKNEEIIVVDKEAAPRGSEPDIDSPGILPISEMLKEDKVALELVTATEQIVKARQFSAQNLKELQERLQYSQTRVDLSTKELSQAKELQERLEARIASLEEKISEKNMKIDQVVEDYRELQNSMAIKNQELQNMLNLEKEKYQKLQEQHQRENQEGILKLKQYEEDILSLETENSNLRHLHKETRKENTYLLNMVNDFTKQMSSTFSRYSNEE